MTDAVTEHRLRSSEWRSEYRYVSKVYDIEHFGCVGTPGVIMSRCRRKGQARVDVAYVLNDGRRSDSLATVAKWLKRVGRNK